VGKQFHRFSMLSSRPSLCAVHVRQFEGASPLSYSSAHSGDPEAVEQLDDSVIALIIRTNGAFVVGIKE
jgi:hypothetical protein